jgi:hypothetical protein
MKRRWIMGRYLTTITLACLILIPSFLNGAETDKQRDVPRLFGAFSPKPGVWSEYAIFDKSTGLRSAMRMSIVGIEADAYWYEVENREGASSNIVKMLVKGDPNNPENIQRLIMKSGANPAQEMPRDLVIMGRRMASHMFEQRSGIPSSPTVNLKNIKTGIGTATVPAGTFNVSLHQIVDTAGKVYAEYKFSENVHPFGVVTSDADNSTMVLVGHGTGAKSLIMEEPTMMIQPPGMPEGMPRGMPPGMVPPPGQDPGSPIQKIPGMGRGYEPQ